MVTCLELWEHSGLQLAWTVHVPTPRLDTVDTLTTSERPGCQDHRRHSLDDAGDAAEDVDHDVAAHLHALGVHAEKQQTCQKGMGAGVES